MSVDSSSLVLMPFGWPVVIYMTIAGMCAGAALVSCWLLWRDAERWQGLARRGLLLAASGIAFGSLFLIADLEAPGRFWMILAHFNPASWIAWGARIITLFGLLAALAWVWLSRGLTSGQMSPGLRGMTAAITVLAFLIGLYPAWILMQAVARPLWGSPWIAPLFCVSALHTGLAALLLQQSWVGSRESDALGGAQMERLLIIVQALLVGLYFWTLTAGYEAAKARLIQGDLGLWLWVGVVLIGWLIPLATTWSSAANRSRLWLRGVCVLIGGLALRTWIVFGGQGSEALISSLR